MKDQRLTPMSVAPLALCAVGLGLIAAVACSAPDPGVGYLGTSHNSANGGTGSSGGTSSGTSEDSGSSTSSGGANDSGASAVSTGDAASTAADSGGDAGAASTSFLGETTPWASNQQPSTTAFQAHTTAGVAQQTPTLDCMSCHAVGGAANDPFLAAGFVATTAGGTTGAVNVEVRAYGEGSDAGASAYTDSNGYFWINPPIGGITGPYNAAIRTATAMQMMGTSQTTIDCQSSTCHTGGQGNIHL